MKKNIPTILLLFCVSYVVEAQFYQVLEYGELIEQDCAANPAFPANTLENWFAYQTTDNTLNGPIDTSVCINLNIGSITIENPIIDQAVFIEYNFSGDSLDFLLSPNDLFQLTPSSLKLDNHETIKTGVDCAEDLCTGFIVEVEIPNEDNTGFNYRNYQFSYLESFSLGFYSIWDYTVPCLSTEYFNHNRLSKFVIKIVPQVETPIEVALQGYSAIYQVSEFDITKWTSLQAQQTIGPKRHAVYLNDWNNLLIYGDTSSYPSQNQLFLVEVFPPDSIATDTPDTIDIFINESSGLIHQPFTDLVGAKINPDSEERHIVNIINDGGQYCGTGIVEKTFYNGGNYIHQDGTIPLPNRMACFAFGKGSHLIVADNATLKYGNEGIGMLMLKTGGSIEIGQNAELIIDNELTMAEFTEDEEPQQIYMALNESSKLTFTKNAKLSNHWSKDGTMKLNVFMNGGILDDANLAPQDRALINRIYPSSENSVFDNLQLGQNTEGNTWFGRFENAVENNLQVAIYDLNGQKLHQETKAISNFYFDLPLPQNLPPFYLIEFIIGNQRIVKKGIRF